MACHPGYTINCISGEIMMHMRPTTILLILRIRMNCLEKWLLLVSGTHTKKISSIILDHQQKVGTSCFHFPGLLGWLEYHTICSRRVHHISIIEKKNPFFERPLGPPSSDEDWFYHIESCCFAQWSEGSRVCTTFDILAKEKVNTHDTPRGNVVHARIRLFNYQSLLWLPWHRKSLEPGMT